MIFLKKNLFLGILFLLIGVFVGKAFFSSDFFKHSEEGDFYYFLEEGVYENQDIFNENMTDLRKKVMEYENHKIYVYVGITRSIPNAERIVGIYEKKGISLKIVKKYLDNFEFLENVEQFDGLLEDSVEDDEILKIEEVVLANYDEIVKRGVSS